MAAERPFITCHALDTVSGKPAAGVDVSLVLVKPDLGASTTFSATTNSDGRVPAWDEPAEPLNAIVAKCREEYARSGEGMMWRMSFNTEKYFGAGNTFFPEVVINFFAKNDEEHYHVPLLLGPWSYTTYRGS